jgi:hypothetical protein
MGLMSQALRDFAPLRFSYPPRVGDQRGLTRIRESEVKMKEIYEAKLWVNKKDIELNPFVEQFLAGTVTGGVRTLKGVEAVRTVELKMLKKAVTLVVNGKALELTQFPNDIISSTVAGVASSLKGVDKVNSLQIDIKVLQKKS